MKNPPFSALWVRFLLLASLACTVGIAAEEVAQDQLRRALDPALPLIQSSADHYITKRDCFSCQHQALPAMTLQLAAGRGLKFDGESAKRQSEFTEEYFAERKTELVEGAGVPGGPYSAAYALVSLAADKRPASETTAALVSYLLKTQHKSGGWRIRTRRPPLESSHFTATALSVRGLQQYVGDENRKDVEAATARARSWLTKNEPRTNEDRTFQVLGLHWSGARRSFIVGCAEGLIARQQDDGGWAQDDERETDAYATGQALAALNLSGVVETSSEIYQKGLAYLVKRQQTDGSWRVSSRSKPIQTYFESGFPHGKSQFISISASCWSCMALILATPSAEPAGDR